MPNPHSDQRSTLAEVLEELGITCTPVSTGGRVDVSLPQLDGWDRLPDGQIPGTHTVLTNSSRPNDADWVTNAVVLHGFLSRPVDADALLEYAFVDSQRLPEWQQIDRSREPHHDLPSARIQGTCQAESLRFVCSNRYVLSHGDDSQYLTQLTITALADDADYFSADFELLDSGLWITEQ